MTQPPTGPPPDDRTLSAPPAAGLSPQTVAVQDVAPASGASASPQSGASAGPPPVMTHGGDLAPDWRPEYRPPPPPKTWTHWVPQTLAGRLAAGMVVLVVVLVGAVGGATYYALDSFLTNRLDQQLQGQASDRSLEQIFAPPSVNGGQGPYSGPRLHGPQAVYAVGVVGGTQYSPFAFSNATGMRLPTSDLRRLTGHPGEAQTVTTTSGNRVRAMAVAVSGSLSITDSNGNVQDNQSGYAVVALSTEDVDDTLHRLVLLELAIGAGAVLIALLVTTSGLRVGLGPLRRVTRTAQEVTSEISPSGGGLDRRVPATGSTTEVGQLADSFNTMLDRVEGEFTARRESEERMRQFLADASHELRTPLTSIRGYAELARLERLRAGRAADADDTLGRIETEGTRMSRLVEDLLLLARGDDEAEDPSGSTHRELVEVADLIDDVVGSVRAAFPQRRIDVDVSAQPMNVVADRDQLVRVLRNLIVNACVHTDPAGAVSVSAHPAEAGVELAVTDEGPGLAAEEAAHVFERFWRADKARSRARGGSGLGMAIVAQIVTAHGGQVRFDSAVDTGSRVSVILPEA